MHTQFSGIDVRKATLDVALLTPQCQVLTQARLANTPAAIKQRVTGLRQQFAAFSRPTCLVCLEHTGRYCRPVLTGLSELKAAIWLEHAAQIKVSTGQVRGKTDAADAVRLGQYAVRYQDRVRLWQPAPPVLVALDRLTARRARLVGVRQQLQPPLSSSEGFCSKAGQRAEEQALAATLQALTAAIGQAGQAIAGLIAGDEHLALLYAQLTSVPGVGPVLATEMLLTTKALRDRTDPKRYASYAGVVPFERSSGQHRGQPCVSTTHAILIAKLKEKERGKLASWI